MKSLESKEFDLRPYVAHWFIFTASILVGMFLFSFAHDIVVDHGGMVAAFRRQFVNGLIISATAGAIWALVLFLFVRQRS